MNRRSFIGRLAALFGLGAAPEVARSMGPLHPAPDAAVPAARTLPAYPVSDNVRMTGAMPVDIMGVGWCGEWRDLSSRHEREVLLGRAGERLEIGDVISFGPDGRVYRVIACS